MSGMIELVARAICALKVSNSDIADTQTLEKLIDDEWPNYEQEARAAIERHAMAPVEAWKAMLTAALADAPGEG